MTRLSDFQAPDFLAPDFLVIGAARAGTTALHAYLRQHPQIFMPSLKEPNFFAFQGEKLNCRGPGADYINNSITEPAQYSALFESAPEEAICGEASPLYLFSENAPANIHRLAPQARLIAILRNPVEQAFSHFLYATKQAIETEPDFTRALEKEEERLAAGWQPLFGYSRFPRYGEQLRRYFDIFPKEQILVKTYEDYQNTPQNVLRDIFAFIGADPSFQPDMSRKLNAGGVPKNRALQDFLMKPNPITGAIGHVVPQDLRWAIRDRIAALNTTRQQTMPRAARDILRARLSDDIMELQELIGRDLSGWLA